MIGKTRESLNLLIIFIFAFLILSVVVLVSYNLIIVGDSKVYDEYNSKTNIDQTNQDIFTIGLKIVSDVKVIFIAIIGGIITISFLVANKDSFLPFFQRILSKFG